MQIEILFVIFWVENVIFIKMRTLYLFITIRNLESKKMKIKSQGGSYVPREIGQVNYVDEVMG